MSGLNIHEMASIPPRVFSGDQSRPSTPGLTRRLPLSRSLESSWQVYHGCAGDALFSRGFRTAVAFFIFGLMNNILFIIVLSVNMLAFEMDLLIGGTGFSWTNCTQGSCAIGRRDAIVSL